MKTIRLVLEEKNEKTGEFSCCQIKIPVSGSHINIDMIETAIMKLQRDLNKLHWDQEMHSHLKKP